MTATSQGQVNFHEWIGDGWAILFSHPEDFTPVCATELGYVAKLSGEFAKRGCKVIGLSVDKVEDHLRWAADIEDLAGTKLDYPLIADEDLSIAKRYDMRCATGGDSSEGRTAADNMTVRTVFLVGPDKKVKMSLTYPMSTGTQLRRAASGYRFVPADREPQGCDPGESVCVGIPGQRATNDLVVSAFTRTVYSTPGSKSEPTEPKGTLVSTTG